MCPPDGANRRGAARAAIRGLIPLLTLAGLPALGALPVRAQEPAPGDVVRITAAGGTGQYVFRELRGDRLVLTGRRGEASSIPVRAVRRLEVRSRGGDGIGTVVLRTAGAALVGGSAGLLVGWSTRKAPPAPQSWCFEFPAGEWCYVLQPRTPTYAVEGAVIGAFAGGAMGLIYGLVAERWTWRSVPLRDLAVEVATAGGGVGLGLRWRP